MNNMSKTTLWDNIQEINSELNNIEKNNPKIIPSIASIYINARKLEKTYNLLTNSPQETAQFERTLENNKNSQLGIDIGKLYITVHQKSNIDFNTANALIDLTTTVNALAEQYNIISINKSKREEAINDIANRYTTIHVVDKSLWKKCKESFMDAVNYAFYRPEISYEC